MNSDAAGCIDGRKRRDGLVFDVNGGCDVGDEMAGREFSRRTNVNEMGLRRAASEVGGGRHCLCLYERWMLNVHMDALLFGPKQLIRWRFAAVRLQGVWWGTVGDGSNGKAVR